MLVALETATDTGSVALGDAAGVAGEVVIAGRTRHAESLLPGLDELLRDTRTARTALRGIVVGAGPGSFTGVRVAAATARGLARGLDVPLYAYSSLAALALEADAESRAVCALFDARRGEVYAACYAHGAAADELRSVMEPAVLTVEELLERMRDVEPIYIGEGAVRYARELGIAAPVPRVPRAAGLLRLAVADIASGHEAGRVIEPAGWEPSYLRPSGAERGIAG